MPIDPKTILELKSEGDVFTYGERETMLYALGIGFGRDPLNERELPFVYENGLKTVPTMATVIAWGQSTLAKSGINYLMVVHGEQRLTVHRPLPPAATIRADERVVGAFDKGAGKGAVIVTEKVISLNDTGETLCTLRSTTFARGDGGFGGPREGAPEPHPIPERAPDETFEAKTAPDQALLYALSGDRNPLHRDPKIAAAAGFPKPIIHGLCTYGTAARAIITRLCDHNPARIRAFDVRFSAPMYPGETVLLDVWKDGKTVSFRARLKDREAMVLNNGRCELAG